MYLLVKAISFHLLLSSFFFHHHLSSSSSPFPLPWFPLFFFESLWFSSKRPKPPLERKGKLPWPVCLPQPWRHGTLNCFAFSFIYHSFCLLTLYSFHNKIAHSVGCLSMPEVVIREVAPEDRAVVICSDGKSPRWAFWNRWNDLISDCDMFCFLDFFKNANYFFHNYHSILSLQASGTVLVRLLLQLLWKPWNTRMLPRLGQALFFFFKKKGNNKRKIERWRLFVVTACMQWKSHSKTFLPLQQISKSLLDSAIQGLRTQKRKDNVTTVVLFLGDSVGGKWMYYKEWVRIVWKNIYCYCCCCCCCCCCVNLFGFYHIPSSRTVPTPMEMEKCTIS